MGPESRSPVAVRVIRPHTSLEEFYNTDLGTITTSTIVLLGANKRPDGVVLRFEVLLADGSPIVRGEGRVIGYMDRTPLGEPGLCLKLVRVDPRSKEILDEVLSRKEAAGIMRSRESVPPAVGSIPPPSAPLADANEEAAPASLGPMSRRAPPPLPAKRGAPTRPPLKAKEQPPPPPESSPPDTPIDVASTYPSEPPLAVDVSDLVMLDENGNSAPPPAEAPPAASIEPPAAAPPPVKDPMALSERNARLDRLRSRFAALSPEVRNALVVKSHPAGEQAP